jgi:hypothetical protein
MEPWTDVSDKIFISISEIFPGSLSGKKRKIILMSDMRSEGIPKIGRLVPKV